MTALAAAALDRFARHIILPQIGGAGQARLAAAHVAVVGAGGIGCPVVQYLAAAGVGRLTIIDDDDIALSNLHRQILFTQRDIGAPKAARAAAAARAFNPGMTVIAHAERLTAANAGALIGGADLVIDGSDNFATRLAVNGAAVSARIPLLSAAVGGFDAQIARYDGWRAACPCYACLVGDDPDRADVNCADAGILGPMTGLVGTLAAMEAIRALAPFGRALTGRLILVDMIQRTWHEVAVPPDPECAACRA